MSGRKKGRHRTADRGSDKRQVLQDKGNRERRQEEEESAGGVGEGAVGSCKGEDRIEEGAQRLLVVFFTSRNCPRIGFGQ